MAASIGASRDPLTLTAVLEARLSLAEVTQGVMVQGAFPER
jgi:hypothetical protein